MNEIVRGTPGRALQVQRYRGEWTATRRGAFLDALATTCNVAQSARSVGLTAGSAHKLRRRDAGFADQWAEALETGYAFLEAQLLAHAMGTGGADSAGEDGGAAFNPELALRLIGQHAARANGAMRRSGGGATYKRVSIAEVERALLKRLKVLDKRFGGT